MHDSWQRGLKTTGGAAIAFLASGWLRGAPEDGVSWLLRTGGRLAALVAIAWLYGGLRGCRHWSGHGAVWRLLTSVFAILSFLSMLSCAWRGIDYVAGSLVPGYIVGMAALGLGVCGAYQKSPGRRGYWLLMALGMGVLVGVADLQIRTSPERTARRFTRCVVTQRWANAFTLITPELQELLRREHQTLAGGIQSILRFPRGMILHRIERHLDTATVHMNTPRSAWGPSAGAMTWGAELRLVRSSSGEWLISGSNHLERWKQWPSRLREAGGT